MTNAAVQAFLAGRGKTGQPILDYILAGDDSFGPVVQSFPRWDETRLGPAPTAADMAAMQRWEFEQQGRRPDVLTLCALTVRARGITKWNRMTRRQKRAAVLAEADAWVTLRQFIETHVIR